MNEKNNSTLLHIATWQTNFTWSHNLSVVCRLQRLSWTPNLLFLSKSKFSASYIVFFHIHPRLDRSGKAGNKGITMKRGKAPGQGVEIAEVQCRNKSWSLMWNKSVSVKGSDSSEVSAVWTETFTASIKPFRLFDLCCRASDLSSLRISLQLTALDSCDVLCRTIAPSSLNFHSKFAGIARIIMLRSSLAASHPFQPWSMKGEVRNSSPATNDHFFLICLVYVILRPR